MARVNTEIHTELNRYPLLFGNVHLLRRRFLGERVRILSFGCSTGEELISLAGFFPGDALFGCDVNEDALAAARLKAAALPDTTVFHSDADNLTRHGPFDIVFANSVLCVNANNERLLRERFPFERFEQMALLLAGLLSEQGVLALFNTSYFPADSAALMEQVRPLRSHFVSTGYVPRFDRDARLELVRRVVGGRGYYERVRTEPRAFADFFDVIYTRSPQIAGFKLDYSGFVDWIEFGGLERVTTPLATRGGQFLREKIFGHHVAELGPAGLQILQETRDEIGKAFLHEVVCRVPGTATGFRSLSDY